MEETAFSWTQKQQSLTGGIGPLVGDTADAKDVFARVFGWFELNDPLYGGRSRKFIPVKVGQTQYSAFLFGKLEKAVNELFFALTVVYGKNVELQALEDFSI